MIKPITQDENILKQISVEVDLRAKGDVILAEEIIMNLIDTAKDAHFNNEFGCGGLASNQIEVLKRIFVIKIKDDKFKAFINPRIISKSKTMVSITGGEGCLSRPGKFTFINRHKKIEVAFNDLKGNKKKASYNGTRSIAFQHELDHLNGILI